jgi:hypothetical protein
MAVLPAAAKTVLAEVSEVSELLSTFTEARKMPG